MTQSVGQQVRKLREQKGLSLTGLSGRAKVAKSYLSSLERDLQSNPSVQLLKKIADALNVSVNTLVYGDENGGHSHDSNEIPDEWKNLVKLAVDLHVSPAQFQSFLEKERRDVKHG